MLQEWGGERKKLSPSCFYLLNLILLIKMIIIKGLIYNVRKNIK